MYIFQLDIIYRFYLLLITKLITVNEIYINDNYTMCLLKIKFYTLVINL